MVWTLGVLFQDMADESLGRSGQESSAFCRQLQQALAEDLSHMSIYDLARPCTQTLLADYKCLISSLKQDWQSSEGSTQLASGVLTLSDLLWDDGLYPLSKILTGLDPQQPGSSAELAPPISLMTQAQVGLSSLSHCLSRHLSWIGIGEVKLHKGLYWPQCPRAVTRGIRNGLEAIDEGQELQLTRALKDLKELDYQTQHPNLESE